MNTINELLHLEKYGLVDLAGEGLGRGINQNTQTKHLTDGLKVMTHLK